MSEKEGKAAPSRRDFLKFASVSAPAAVAVAATTAVRAQADANDPSPEGEEWRETAHMRAYLDSARF